MKHGTCLHPTSLSAGEVISYSNKLGLSTAILYRRHLTKEFTSALKSEGISMGLFLGYRPSSAINPTLLEDIDYVFLGDEVNITGPSGTRVEAASYYGLASLVAENLREIEYQGDVVMACLGGVNGVFRKWWAKFDKEYMSIVLDMEKKHGKIFDAYGVNPFHMNIPSLMKDISATFGRDDVPFYFAGFGYDNLSADDWFAQKTGAWYRQMRDMKKYDNIKVSSTWCMATYENLNVGQKYGMWGHVETQTGELTRSGRHYLSARRKL